ncbi:hypothetical protein Mycch_1484 [Mycolicibacterium chubuense NBB4]|uniref:Uncharacterized protein n=1 Tax=Mycolicibacterium chubuense (strain NBB4) TaxID=710421 RepID=I4BG77_MYCCN|nr:hypothetical protein [Mycolicibacterium chubuense]AFM16284.1 hypothetical protein Mycch_1484 [Mycolicibacterium chubuense NBB4]
MRHRAAGDVAPEARLRDAIVKARESRKQARAAVVRAKVARRAAEDVRLSRRKEPDGSTAEVDR